MRTLLPGLFLALSCASPKPVPPSAPAVRRSIVLNGQRVGFSTVSWNPDGSIANAVDIHENGRGPHADAVIRLAPDGTIASLDASGLTELNAPVDEHFIVRRGRASWSSREERGEKDLTGPAYFIPNSATDSDAFLLAALRKNGGTLQLLPGGIARLEKVGDATVAVAGAQTHLGR